MKFRIGAVIGFMVTMMLSWQLGGWAGYRLVERESREESFRYSQLVANELNRYRPIPELMAEHPLLLSVLKSPDNPGLVQAANEEMKQMARIVGSSDVYLLDRTGLTIAASNYYKPNSFIGRRYDYRPYFRDAIRTGRSALYFALGTMSDIRGLYFSSPVAFADDRVAGVIVVKVQVEELESQWQRPATYNDAEMVVLDDDGISFLASRNDWLYRDFEPGGAVPADDPGIRLRYPEQPLQPMDINIKEAPFGLADDVRRLRIVDGDRSREYLSVRTPLPHLDWSLQVMIGTRSVLWTRVESLIAGTVIFLGALLTLLYLRERYRLEAELAERGERLELRVAERTQDLELSNRQLTEEVRQRKAAEDELKETQQELIQAAKLAVLGQMSAGLNHEMNQPLTAIQAYARNSRRFLERGSHQTVDANLSEIIALCHKMAELTRQFKIFARKSEGLPATVDLRMAIDAALKIITAQDSGARVTIDWQRPREPALCHGDLIRVEQVLVNLIANAVQAVESVADPTVSIDLLPEGDQWLCRVRDNGSGLPADSEQIFEPFFTTKSMKQGLGLGLSISRQIVDALGGRLTGRNRSDGPGAEFLLTLNTRG